MYVTYDPDTLLPTATAEEPLPPGILECYQALEGTQGLHWFETPDGSIFNMMVQANESGVLVLAPRTPTPGALSASTAGVGAEVDLTGLLAGTTLLVDGAAQELGHATSEALSFSDPGVYSIELHRLPHTPTAFSLTVS